MNRFEWSRMSDEAEEVLAAAADEARLRNDDHCRGEHLFVAILRVNRGVAAEVLRSAGLDLQSARSSVASNVAGGQPGPLLSPVLLTAMGMAVEGGTGSLTSGHLLLALAAPEFRTVIQRFGLAPAWVIDQVTLAMGRDREFLRPVAPDDLRVMRKNLLAEVDRLCEFINGLPNGWDRYFLPLAEELRAQALNATGDAIRGLLSPTDEVTPSENIAVSGSIFVDRMTEALVDARSLLRSKGFDPDKTQPVAPVPPDVTQ